MDLGPHAFFIIAAYAATALILAALALRAFLDHAAQRRALAELERGSPALGRRCPQPRGPALVNGLSPTTTAPDTLEGAKPRLRLLHLLPALVFLALAIVFLIRLYSGDPSKVPSALIGRPAPSFALEPLAGASQNGQPLPGLASDDLKGKLTVVNVWASWCAPCRQEHPVLMELAKDSSLRVVGINYKDTPENARRFLGAFGNPFAAVGVDPGGRAAIDWGVYGVPETFVVGPDGTIRYKHIGPILPEQMLWFRQQLRKAAAPG
jgi:cytochrome c biogenesis protein CcmG, thiol:disulfide interchange protein DsbE